MKDNYVRDVEPEELFWFIITTIFIFSSFLFVFAYGGRFAYRAINIVSIFYILPIGFSFLYICNQIGFVKPVYGFYYAAVTTAIFILSFLSALLFCKIFKTHIIWASIRYHFYLLQLHNLATALVFYQLPREFENDDTNAKKYEDG